jgi:ParB/RepB/Spo0J family partition protein
MSEASIVQLKTQDCRPADDNRPAERPGIKNLVEAIRNHGQLVPGLVCPHPDATNAYLILDGIGRWYACGQIGIAFRAMLLPGVVSEAERIKLRLLHNVIRRSMSPQEISDDAIRFMQLRGMTQQEAAAELSISPATLSRALTTTRRVPEELKHLVDQVRPSIAAMIASLPGIDAMRDAFTFATTAGPEGPPTRERVARYIERFKDTKPRGQKAKTIRGEVEGRRIQISVEDGDTGEDLSEFFSVLKEKLKKYKESPAESLGFLFSD